MIQVYDRSRRALVDEQEVSVGSVKFLYNTRTGRILLKTFVYRKPISNLYACYEKSSLSRGKVKKFIRKYNIDTGDCEQVKYRNFNDFFTRRRVEYVNQTADDELPAIADSKLTVYPLSPDCRFSIKNSSYSVGELLEDEALGHRFDGGLCMIFRLAPNDYHRYVYPDSGTQEALRRIKGVLHSVNPISADHNVYSRNARRWTMLHTDHFGDIIQMEVGALLVGKIRNHHTEAGVSFNKLEEKGYFEYGGSTVVLLIPRGVVQVDADIMEQSLKGIETKVTIGERVAKRIR